MPAAKPGLEPTVWLRDVPRAGTAANRLGKVLRRRSCVADTREAEMPDRGLSVHGVSGDEKALPVPR